MITIVRGSSTKLMSEKCVLAVVVVSDFFVSNTLRIVYFNLVILCNVSSWVSVGGMLRLTSHQAHRVLQLECQVALCSHVLPCHHVRSVG